MSHEHVYSCSFCGKGKDEVKRIIAGPGTICICDECIELCTQIGQQEANKERTASSRPNGIMKPSEINAILNDYVIGQEDAKRALSSAAYEHSISALHNKECDKDDRIEKKNILLFGPTGSGKTYTIQRLARILGRTFYQTDASKYTAQGYVGNDVDEIITGLIAAAENDIEKAQRGIIYIDEIDKIRRSGGSGKDVNGEAVQQAILKMIEGDVVEITVRDGNGKKTIQFDTSDVLFIFSGAFAGVEQIVRARLGVDESEQRNGIGFGAKLVDNKAKDVRLQNFYREITTDDLTEFGMIPEFLGRIPIRVSLDKLTVDDLVRILTEPKNAIVKQYQRFFNIEGVELVFTDDALRTIAAFALEQNTGARGLTTIIEKIIAPFKYDLPDLAEQNVDKVTIDLDMAEKGCAELRGHDAPAIAATA